MRFDLRSILRTACLVVAGLVTMSQTTNAADARQQVIDYAKQNLQQNVQKLESYLARGGNAVVDGWQQYLNLDALHEELRQPKPDIQRLNEVWHRFYAAENGMHQPQFLAVRDSLHRYCVVASTPSGDLRELHAEALVRLRKDLDAYRVSDHRDDAADIGPTLAWLKYTGARDPLMDEVKKELGHPNSYARVSTRLANHFLNRPIDERERVSANIGGAQTSGDAHTKARLWLQTSPSQDVGAFDIRLTGNVVTSNSVAQKGPVTVFGGANTTIDARVRLTMREDLLRVDPPVVKANTKSYITDIQAKRRIIERIAERRAPKEMPAAEREAARQVEQRLQERLGKETSTLMAQANSLYNNKVREPMLRRGAWPAMKYSSDRENLYVQMVKADDFQVSTRNSPPEWPVDGDLTLSGHESFFENFFEGVFAGREIKDTQFLYLMELLTGESPRPLWVHEREPRWSVIMDDARPLRARCRNGQLQVTLAVKETLRGSERFNTPAHMTASFEVSPSTEGPVFHRLGSVQVEFPEREELSVDAEQLRAFLTRKFSAIMPEELHFDGLAAPAGGFGDQLNQLQFQQAHFESGWATIRYKLDLTKKPKATLVSTSSLNK